MSCLCPSNDGVACASGYHWEGGWIAFAATHAGSDRTADEPILLRQPALPSKVHLITSAGRTRVRFQPSGGNAGSNVTFTFCDGRGAASASAYAMANNGALHSTTVDPTYVDDGLRWPCEDAPLHRIQARPGAIASANAPNQAVCSNKRKPALKAGFRHPDLTCASLGTSAYRICLFVARARLARADARSGHLGYRRADKRDRDQIGTGGRVGGTRNSRSLRNRNDLSFELALAGRTAQQRRRSSRRCRVDLYVRRVDGNEALRGRGRIACDSTPSPSRCTSTALPAPLAVSDMPLPLPRLKRTYCRRRY